MKAILILILLSVTASCAVSSKNRTTSKYERKHQMMKCVTKFLSQDVAPSDSLAICGQIFSRFEPSIMHNKVTDSHDR